MNIDDFLKESQDYLEQRDNINLSESETVFFPFLLYVLIKLSFQIKLLSTLFILLKYNQSHTHKHTLQYSTKHTVNPVICVKSVS